MHSVCSTPRYLKGNMHGLRVLPAASHVELLNTQVEEHPADLHSATVGTLNFGLLQSSQQIALSLGLCRSLHLVHVMLVRVVASRIRTVFLSLMRERSSVCEFVTMVSCSSVVRWTSVWCEMITFSMLMIFSM